MSGKNIKKMPISAESCIFAGKTKHLSRMKHGRHIFLTLLLLAVLSSATAQRFGGGLMLGPTFSTMSISGNDSTRFRPDFTGGVRIALIPTQSVFGAEIDVLYSRQGASMKKGLDDKGNTIRYKERSQYINVPLLLNIYFRKWRADDKDESRILKLRIGPQVGFCIGGNEVMEVKGKKKVQYITPWEKGSFNWLDYGFTAAVNYWFVEVRYTYGMANVFKEGEKSTNHVISVTWSDIW